MSKSDIIFSRQRFLDSYHKLQILKKKILSMNEQIGNLSRGMETIFLNKILKLKVKYSNKKITKRDQNRRKNGKTKINEVNDT